MNDITTLAANYASAIVATRKARVATAKANTALAEASVDHGRLQETLEVMRTDNFSGDSMIALLVEWSEHEARKTIAAEAKKKAEDYLRLCEKGEEEAKQALIAAQRARLQMPSL